CVTNPEIPPPPIALPAIPHMQFASDLNHRPVVIDPRTIRRSLRPRRHHRPALDSRRQRKLDPVPKWHAIRVKRKQHRIPKPLILRSPQPDHRISFASYDRQPPQPQLYNPDGVGLGSGFSGLYNSIMVLT